EQSQGETLFPQESIHHYLLSPVTPMLCSTTLIVKTAAPKKSIATPSPAFNRRDPADGGSMPGGKGWAFPGLPLSDGLIGVETEQCQCNQYCACRRSYLPHVLFHCDPPLRIVDLPCCDSVR